MSVKFNEMIAKVGTDTSGKWVSADRIETFAELFVQECSVALSPMLRDMISRGQAVELIQKHFGVEE